MSALSPGDAVPASYAAHHGKLVAAMVALERFQGEIRLTSSREEILALTIDHLKAQLSLRTGGFYLADGKDLDFTLRTPLPAEDAAELNVLVDQAIESGTFGWALNHHRPAAFRTPEGKTTLILAALRTRQRFLGMFAAVLDSAFVPGWDAHSIIIATSLTCAANAILSEALTAELQGHNRRLEALVEQRTHQLLLAKEAAELANRAKGDFLATVSHELRTPLSAILGYTQILRQSDSLPADHAIPLETILRSADHLLSLVNDLLDLSKAEAAAIQIAPARVPLRSLVEETLNVLRSEAEEKRLSMECVIHDRVPAAIVVDARRLKQVLLNLLGNAIKFTERGGVRLEIAPQGGFLRFAIRDTGPGIEPQYLSRLFQPFQQFGRDALRSSGSGLGLSITKKILEAMGMEIQFDTAPGRGSCFWFDLPDNAAGPAHHDHKLMPAAAEVRNSTPVMTSNLAPTDRAALEQWAARGDVLALQAHLEQLAGSSETSNPLVNELLDLARACRLKAVRALLASL